MKVTYILPLICRLSYAVDSSLDMDPISGGGTTINILKGDRGQEESSHQINHSFGGIGPLTRKRTHPISADSLKSSHEDSIRKEELSIVDDSSGFTEDELIFLRFLQAEVSTSTSYSYDPSSSPSSPPNGNPTKAPTKTPTKAPTKSPSTTPDNPTKAPTKPPSPPTPTPPTSAPISSPTSNGTPSPTHSQSPTGSGLKCRDSMAPFDQKGVKRVCAWVARRKKYRCRRMGLQRHCPVTCDKCNEFRCMDSKKTFYLFNGNAKKCEWAKKKRTRRRCKKAGVTTTCRATCGFCV